MSKQQNSFSNRRHGGAVDELTCSLLLTPTAAACGADPGAVALINQANVLASGGFPYTITQPGSYRLASDLAANTTAISIQADEVTLNLNGFRVLCHGSGVPTIVCYGFGTTIRNGYVLRSGGALASGQGIHLTAPRARIVHVAVSNHAEGIYAENGVDLWIADSAVSDNWGDGIVGGNGLLAVSNSVISGNGGASSASGILVRGAGLVRRNAIIGNGCGITLRRMGAVLANNAIVNNSVGIVAQEATGFGSNTFAGNRTDFSRPVVSMERTAKVASVGSRLIPQVACFPTQTRPKLWF